MPAPNKPLDNAVEQLADLLVDGEAFKLECYQNVGAIEALEQEWLSLEEACKEDFTYFQSFSWCYEYFKQFADDITDKHCPIPQVFVLRKDEKPIMIWPLMRIQSRTGLKILTTATEPLGQYSNLIFDSEHFNKKIGQTVFKEIIENANADSISLNHFPKDCLIDEILDNQGIKENSNFESSILDLSQYETWDAYTQTLSKGQRKNRRRNKNKLSAKGEVSYKVFAAETQEYKTLTALALKMKKQWLLETGRKPGILAEEPTRMMLLNLKQVKAADEACPVVHALYLDEHPIAIELGIIQGNRYYSYLGAIDWAHKDLGPGTLQLAMAQEWAMEKNIRYFDLMHDPSEYKSSWTNKTHKVLSRNIPITMKGYIYSQLWKTYIRPKLKTMYHFAGTKNRERLNKLLDIFRS